MTDKKIQHLKLAAKRPSRLIIEFDEELQRELLIREEVNSFYKKQIRRLES